MQDRATKNTNNAEDKAAQTNSRREKSANRQASDLTTANKASPIEPPKDGAGESGSLNKFREVIKDVLEEITSLEVNTMIVGSIPITKFDAQEFYTDLIENTMYKTEEGLQDIKRSLLERSAELKQKGSSLSQSELDHYNQDLEIYKRAERAFSDRQNSTDPRQKEQFEIEQACYEELANKVLKLQIPKNAEGKVITDAPMIRYFRKLWEFEQSVLNGERIYAQTRFQLDGDLTNRFVDDLFVPSRSKIDPTMAKLVFDLHHQAVENAQKQWTGLITTCVNLVKDLMPFRTK
jgi:prolyl oligopeptidase PreP (S9A serine peptidase family)